MQNDLEDFLFEYEYIPSPDAEERLAQAWEIILALILEDYQNELQRVDSSESETC
jgi:hypothetical protein